ncbi:MAG: hypothetical protein HYR51_15680 [Candidatus Rokubacteria bacterium]|nr:hypothetical protein [Candidatus Rokubacteria bacterium]
MTVSPLATWFPTDAAVARFRRTRLGRTSIVLAPRDESWRRLAPPFERLVELAHAGLPFHVAADRRQGRAPDRDRLRDALAGGATVFLPQAHQVLPRVARLMVALRGALLGPFRDAASYLFLVEGRGREGMGLHHDGDVDAFWLQLDGRRTVTLGPPVARGTPEELDAPARGRGWRTLALAPGSLLHVPARTPHRVVCHERSLALTLTWARARRRGNTDWDVASGRAEPWPPDRAADRLWAQVPVTAGPLDRRRRAFTLSTPEGRARVPAAAHAVASRLAPMPAVRLRADDARVAPLVALGVLADEDLPLVVVPQDPSTLDGWTFG